MAGSPSFMRTMNSRPRKKRPGGRFVFRMGWVIARRGSEAFFRQAGADGGALAGLEFRVGFADDVNRALALDDLAIGMAALGGGER